MAKTRLRKRKTFRRKSRACKSGACKSRACKSGACKSGACKSRRKTGKRKMRKRKTIKMKGGVLTKEEIDYWKSPKGRSELNAEVAKRKKDFRDNRGYDQDPRSTAGQQATWSWLWGRKK